MFTLDSNNGITFYQEAPPASDGVLVFDSQAELAAADLTSDRLVAIWNDFAGAPPFGDIKPVKKFENRKIAVARIWSACQRLISDAPATTAPEQENTTMPKTKKTKAASATPNAPREGSKTETVIRMLRRKSGATLAELTTETGWAKHSIRGMIAGALKTKMGLAVESFKPEGGERTYRIAS